MDDLTNEQKYLLVSMYKEVLSRQPALSMEKSNYFHDSDEIRDMFLPESSSDYVSTLCWKLKSKAISPATLEMILQTISSSKIQLSFTWSTDSLIA